jgi:hypothetical protein
MHVHYSGAGRGGCAGTGRAKGGKGGRGESRVESRVGRSTNKVDFA